jgi:hypothetical protein
MKDKRGLHLKLQEMIDCYATTDPLKEMDMMKQGEADTEEGPLKWLALSILHGINAHAKKISIVKTREGDLNITVEYRGSQLPTPAAATANELIPTVRGITHLEEPKGKIPLTVGIRDSSIEMQVKVKLEGDKEKVTLKFPKDI